MQIKLRTLSILFVLAACISLPVCAAQSDPAPEILMQGAKKWIAKERPDQARSMLKKLILIDPASMEALFMLGNIEIRMGKPEEALGYLRAMERIAPNSSLTNDLAGSYRLATTDKDVLERARVLVREGKHEDAKKILTQAFHSSSPRSEMAIEYYRILGASEAEYAHVQKELNALYKETADTRYRLLLLELQSNQPDRVETAISGYAELAGRSNINRKSVRQGWLQALYKLPNNDDKNVKAIKKFLAYYPEDSEAAQLLIDVQKFITMQSQFARQPAALGKSPTSVIALTSPQPKKQKTPNIVAVPPSPKINLTIQQKEEVETPDVVTDDGNHDVVARTDMPSSEIDSTIQQQEGEEEEEVAASDEDSDDEDPDVVARTEALDMLQDGNLEAAESALLALLNRRPQDPEIFGGLGMIRLRQGQHAKAATLFEQALQTAQAVKENTARWEALIKTANFWGGLRIAESFLEERQLDDAEDSIQRALALIPGNPEGLAVWGKIRVAKHDDAGAEALYREALNTEGYNVAALVGLVEVLSRTARTEEALTILEQVLQDYPLEWKNNPDSQARLLREEANLYLATNRSGLAMKALEQAIAVAPKNPWVRFSLAKLYIGLHLAPLGRQVVQDGVVLNPEDPEMRYVQAMVLLTLDDPAGALGTLDAIPESDMTSAMKNTRSRALNQYATQQAQIKLAQGDRKEAIRIMSVAEAQSEGNYSGMEQVAEGWFRLGLQEQGLRAMQKLQPPVPLETQVHYASLLNRANKDSELEEYLPSLALSQSEDENNRRYREAVLDIELSMAGRQFDKLWKAGKKEEAQQLADSVFSAYRLDNLEYFRVRRSYFYNSKLPADAIQLLRQDKEQVPDDLDIRWELANAYHEAKQEDNAKKELHELLALTLPDDMDGRIRIAKLQQSVGDDVGARQTMHDLLARYPNDSDALLQAGNMAQGGGHYNEAMGYYERVKEPIRNALHNQEAMIGAEEQQEDSGILLNLHPAIALQNHAGANASPQLSDSIESKRIYQVALAGDAARPKQNIFAGSSTVARAKQEMTVIEARRTAKIETGIDIFVKQASDGTSTYNATEVPVMISFPIGYEAQGMVHIDKVNIDSGSLSSAFSEASSFGTIQAFKVVPPQPLTPSSSGFSVGLGYEQSAVKVDIGKVGMGFPVSNIVGGIRTAGSIDDLSYSLNLSRRPYTGSQISYAGMTDPLTGAAWGGVTNTGLMLWIGSGQGSVNVSGIASYGLLRGKNVLDNDRLFLRAVVDKDVYKNKSTIMNVGVGSNFTRFAENQSYYTFGHGGYYSPQSSLSLGVPVELSGHEDRFAYRIKTSLSYSWTQEDAALYYPTDPLLQAKGGNAIYAGGNGGGAGASLQAVAEYRLLSNLVLGGRFSMDRSAYYAPNSFLLYLRYLFKLGTESILKLDPLVPYSQY